MPTIRLYDGTRDVRFGKALLPAIGEIAKYHTMYCTGSVPGSIDIPGYTIVKQAERAAYNSRRRQVDYKELILGVVNHPRVQPSPGIDTIIISEEDFYTEGLEWGFGAATRDTHGSGYIAISTARLPNPAEFTHVVTHELGHLYGAAPAGRRNTENSLGSHCTNLCIMQQKLSMEDMQAHVRQLAWRADKFCVQCQQDLVRFPG